MAESSHDQSAVLNLLARFAWAASRQRNDPRLAAFARTAMQLAVRTLSAPMSEEAITRAVVGLRCLIEESQAERSTIEALEAELRKLAGSEGG
jgi:hypothetical protein